MAIYCQNPTDYLTRASGLVSPTGPYTVLFYAQFVSSGLGRAVFGTRDLAYANWEAIYSDVNFPLFDLSVATPTEQDMEAPAITPATWYPVALVRFNTSTHLLYVNNVLAGAVGGDVSGLTWNQIFLGNDGVTGVGDMQFARFREWNVALTQTQMAAEFASPVAVLTAGLVTDTPLTRDVNDISGNGHNWTIHGAPTFVADPFPTSNATSIASLIAQARIHLVEPAAAFWTDAELMGHMQNGAKDLWKKIVGQYKEHFVTINDTTMVLPKYAPGIVGVPTDMFRPIVIEPRILGQNNPNQGLIFKPRKRTDPDFIQANAADPQTPQSTVIFYDVINPGAPVGPPGILTAPQVTDDVLLRGTYNNTLPPLSLTGNNPIPGESDNALIAWTVAYARSKEGSTPETRVPDANWMTVYATEKTNTVAELSVSRSEQDQEVVEAVFQDMWPDWQ